MKKTMDVVAAPLADPALTGMARVPLEGTHGRFITEISAVYVPLTAYYLRRLALGELIEATPNSSSTEEE